MSTFRNRNIDPHNSKQCRLEGAALIAAALSFAFFFFSGWMTSRARYHSHILPRWQGPINGHWDLSMQYSVFGQGSPNPAHTGYRSH